MASFWDNFAGSMASGLVKGATAAQGMLDKSQEMGIREAQQRRIEEDRGIAAQTRAEERAATAAQYAQTGVSLAGAAAPQPAAGLRPPGAMNVNGPMESADTSELPPNASTSDAPVAATSGIPATPTQDLGGYGPQADEDNEMARARDVGATPFAPPAANRSRESALPVGSAATGVDTKLDIPKALQDQAAKGSKPAARAIEAIRARQQEALKLDSDLKSAETSREATRTNIARTKQAMTQEQYEFNRKRAQQTAEQTLAMANALPDDSVALTDASVKDQAQAMLSNLKTENDVMDDGQRVNVTKTGAGFRIDRISERTGEVMDSADIKTVGDLKRVAHLNGKYIMGDGYGKSQQAALADDLTARTAKTLMQTGVNEAEAKRIESEGRPKVYEFASAVMKATPDQYLDDSWREDMGRTAEMLYRTYPDITKETVAVPLRDAEGKEIRDENGVVKTQRMDANGLLKMLALGEPNTKITDATGKQRDAQDVLMSMSRNPQDVAAVAQLGGGDVAQGIVAGMTKRGVPENVAQALARKYAPLFQTQALRTAATPKGTQAPIAPTTTAPRSPRGQPASTGGISFPAMQNWSAPPRGVVR